jgi:predicted nucleotide-binding protein
MDGIGVAMAKLAGIRKGLITALDEGKRGNPANPLLKTTYAHQDAAPYFTGAVNQLKVLRAAHPDLFGDFRDIGVLPLAADKDGRPTGNYARVQLERLVRSIDEIFLSHGRAPDWRQVQSFIERDVDIPTLELAQEANGGSTIMEKLERGAAQCDSAVIVMTGDDADIDGQARTRENVMHEIGYFHGRYGRSRVILLHEDGVSIPTNLAGVVYVPFPKGLITAVEGTLARELRALYGAR